VASVGTVHPAGSRAVAAGALVRRLRADRPVVLGVLAVVAATSFVLAAMPRLAARTADDGLRDAVARATAAERNVEISEARRIPAGGEGEPLASVAARGQALEGEFGPALRDVVDARTFAFDLPRMIVFDVPGKEAPRSTTRYLTVGYASEAERHVELVAGRLPRAQATAEPVLEVALSVVTAGQLGVEPGDRVVLAADPDEGLARFIPLSRRKQFTVEVAGVFDVTDPQERFWFPDARLHQARTRETPDKSYRWIYAHALAAPADYGALLAVAEPAPLRYSWRYLVAPGAFGADSAERLAADVRSLEARYRPTGFVDSPQTSVQTGLAAVLERYQGGRATSDTVLAIASVGLLAVALTVLGLLAALNAERRAREIALVRSRGASLPQVLLSQGAESLALALPAGLVGYALAALLGGRGGVLATASVAGVVIATAILVAAAALGPARRAAVALEREDVIGAGPSPRRLALEALVVVAAAGGVYLLRRRGLTAGSSPGGGGGPDLYLAAVPVLLGLAVGLAALRLYPLPLRGLGAAAAGRRDLLPALALRRVSRAPAVSAVPLLVLLVAVSVAVFASTLVHSIGESQRLAAWESVGAAFRVDASPGSPLGRRAEPLGGAQAYVTREVELASGAASARITLVAVEAREYAAVTSGTPVATRVPEGGSGTPVDPVPALATREPVGGRPLDVGELVTLEVEGRTVAFLVAGLRDRLAGVPAGEPAVVASLASLHAALTDRTLAPTRLYLTGAPSRADELERRFPDAVVSSRERELAAVEDAPLVAGTVRGFRAAFLAAAAYALLAVGLAVALTERARARDLSYLRALGLSDRQAVGLRVLELGPPLVLALGIGTAFGAVLAHIIEPGLDLAPFTGAEGGTTLTFDAAAALALGAGLLAFAVLAVAVARAAGRRANLAQSLRAEER
jgi:putative ABC transport system permease protein